MIGGARMVNHAASLLDLGRPAPPGAAAAAAPKGNSRWAFAGHHCQIAKTSDKEKHAKSSTPRGLRVRG